MLAGERLSHAVPIDKAHVTQRQIEGDTPLFAWLQLDPFECPQCKPRSTFEVRRVDVKLHDFFAGALADVADRGADAQHTLLASIELLDTDRPVFEGRIAQPVSE